MKKIFLAYFLLTMALGVTAQELYDIKNVKEIRITFERENWADLLNRFKEEDKDRRLTGSVTIDGVKYDKIGVRHKGNSSYFNVRNSGSTKLPFNIKANHKIKGQTFPGGFTSLKLSNVFRDPSFLREVLAYDIAQKYMPSPKANFVKLYINDQYLGLYNNTESVDEKFLVKHFGENKGTLVKCDPDWHGKTPSGCKKGENGSLNYLGTDSLCYYDLYEMKTKNGWKDLIRLAKAIEDGSKLEKYLNVDQALWMLAYNNVLVNLDSYSGRLCHNYYVYKDDSGRFNTIPWDMNLNFGGFRFVDTKSVLNTEKMQTLSPLSNFKNQMRPLISKLLSNKLYRKIYLAHIRTILEENFANGEYIKRAKEIQAIIDSEVKGDQNKLYSYEAFKANLESTTKAGKSPIIGITELMEPRIAYLKKHPLLVKTPPLITKVEHTKTSDGIVVGAQINQATEYFLFYRKKGFGPFKKTKMNDEGTDGDIGVSDGITSGLIPFNGPAEYYIMEVNYVAAMFSPQRAAFEVYEVK